MDEGVALLHAIQDVYLNDDVTIAVDAAVDVYDPLQVS